MQHQSLRIIHFNDVYDIQPSEKEPIGGAARFKSAIESFRTPDTLVLFSGDAFSPSILSNVTQGQHMLPPLNSFGIDVACLGNHDFDFPLAQSIRLKDSTNFPWLLSNVYDRVTGRRLGEAEQYVILNRGGFKIGIFSLAEKEWLEVLKFEYDGRCEYVDFVEYGQLMVNTLRNDHHCDIVIALTHMMGHNDTKLAQKVSGIDFILGGHDHLIRSQQINDTVVIKSGTNFKHMTVLQLFKNPAATVAGADNFHIQKNKYSVARILEDITSKYKPDPTLQKHVDYLYRELEAKQNSVVCITEKQIDIRFGVIRKSESPFIRLMADWYKVVMRADFVLINSGNVRSDRIIKPGPLTFSVYTNMIEDGVVTKRIKGSLIKDLLENCVSMYPNLSGRFSTVSGISFTWDSNRPSFHRVLAQTIRINGDVVRQDQDYIVCTHSFHSTGGDGFSCLKEAPYVISPKDGFINIQVVEMLLDKTNPLVQRFTQENAHQVGFKEFQGKELLLINLNEDYHNITML